MILSICVLVFAVLISYLKPAFIEVLIVDNY